MSTENPFPYRHRLAVEAASWLLDTLDRAVTDYHERLQIRYSIATLTGEDTFPITRELCYAHAALEQIHTEKGNHNATPNP